VGICLLLQSNLSVTADFWFVCGSSQFYMQLRSILSTIAIASICKSRTSYLQI